MNQYITKVWSLALLLFIMVIGFGNFSFIGDPTGDSISKIDPSIQWEFFEQQLLSPEEVHRQYGTGERIQFPHSFKEQYGTSVMYGTYAAKIKLPEVEGEQNLAIYVPFQYGSYELYVGEKLVAKNGVVGSTKEEQVPEMAPKIGQLHVAGEEVLVTMQLSNFHSARGGFVAAPYIGEFKSLVNTHNTAIIFRFFITGIIVIASMFALLYGWFNNRNYQILLFSLFSMALAVRALFSRPYIYSITILNVSWQTALKIEMLCSLLAVTIALKCLFVYFVPTLNRKILWIFRIIFAIQFVLIVVTEPLVFQQTFEYVFSLAMLLLLYIYGVSIPQLKKVNAVIAIHYIGTLVVLMTAIYDFIVVKFVLDRPLLVLYSIAIYVVLVSSLICWQFAQRQKSEQLLKQELLELNASLDMKIKERTQQLEQANEALAKLATIDALTGIGNRYAFDEQLHKAFRGVRSQEDQLGLMMIDIDEFKKYNDYYGHIDGDKLLQEVVQTIAEQLPEDVSFARYGGEEFAIIYPQATEKNFVQLGEQIVNAVAAKRFQHIKHPLGYVTISMGGYLMGNVDSFASEKELIRLADEQLYKAKNNGKNLFVYAE